MNLPNELRKVLIKLHQKENWCELKKLLSMIFNISEDNIRTIAIDFVYIQIKYDTVRFTAKNGNSTINRHKKVTLPELLKYYDISDELLEKILFQYAY